MVVIATLLIISIFPISGNFQVKTVLSGSMEPAIKTGSIIVIKPVKEYKIGDVICFGLISKTKTPITHRILDIEIAQGIPSYVTKGDANNIEDTRAVKEADIIGKVLFSVPYVGYLINTAQKPFGFLLLIIIPAVVVIVDEIRKIFQEVKKNKNLKNV